MSYARLITRLPGEADREVKLSGQDSIGRAFDNSIRIQAKGVSRYHAIIEERGGEFWLSDLGSINGTTVNDDRIAAKCKLEDGDRISISDEITLEFRSSEAAQPSPPVATSTASEPSLETLPAETLPAPRPAAQSSGPAPRIFISVAAALILVGAVALLLASFANDTDKGATHIISPTSGATIDAPAVLRIEVSEPKNIRRVIYQIDGQEVASSEAPPNYEAQLDPNKLNLEGTRKLSVIIEDKQGHANPLPETVLLSFSLKPPGDSEPMPVARPGVNGKTIPSVDTRQLVGNLAYQISKQRDYVFSPDFISQVERYTRDYLDVSLDERRNLEIARAFSTDQGLNHLLGLVMAMSRSKFRETATASARADERDPGVGLFRLPKSVAITYLKEGETESAIDDPKRSTLIAAEYMKDIFYRFRFAETDFIYAVACFGLPSGKVGAICQALNTAAPDPPSRKDFWKLIKLVIADSNATTRVAQFFAAGIVGMNPDKFGLSFRPLNSL